MKKQIKIPAWAGLLGLFGFLGFLPAVGGANDPNHSQYFFFIFFGFFSWFFWSKLMGESADERLIENQKRATQSMCTLFSLLSFFLLFALSKGAAGSAVLLLGSLGYAVCMILSPALVLFYDRVSD